MIAHLAVLLDTFPGAPNQTRCFAHILNLVAKSVLRQFEGPKKEKVAQALAAVVDEIDGDDDEGFDSETNEGGDECDDVDDELVDDDDDELPDELDELSEEEVLSIKESVKPIRLVLTKVSQFNKYKHHSTNQQWFYSFEVYPTLSKIHQPSSCLSGTKFLQVFLSIHA
jgi:hypothetical protein